MESLEHRPACLASGEVAREQLAAFLRCADQRLLRPPRLHRRRQPPDDRAPLALAHDLGGAVVGDDAGVALGERDIDEDAVALRAMRQAADDELLERRAMRGVMRSRRLGSERTAIATRKPTSWAT